MRALFSEDQKRVIFGIMKYLQQQVTSEVIPKDNVESLEGMFNTNS